MFQWVNLDMIWRKIPSGQLQFNNDTNGYKQIDQLKLLSRSLDIYFEARLNATPGPIKILTSIYYIFFTIIVIQNHKKSNLDEVCIEDSNGYIAKGIVTTVSTTVSGKQCQKWSDQLPHTHVFAELGDNNYCKSESDHPNAWCYTTDPDVRWEDCKCPGIKLIKYT